MSKSDERTRKVPGTVIFKLPAGWEYHPKVSGYIMPTLGPHKGVPMAKNSALAWLMFDGAHECDNQIP